MSAAMTGSLTDGLVRRGAASQWAELDPVLPVMVVGIETDTGRMKWGDHRTPWTRLCYLGITGPDGEAITLRLGERLPDGRLVTLW